MNYEGALTWIKGLFQGSRYSVLESTPRSDIEKNRVIISLGNISASNVAKDYQNTFNMTLTAGIDNSDDLTRVKELDSIMAILKPHTLLTGTSNYRFLPEFAITWPPRNNSVAMVQISLKIFWVSN